MRFDLEELASWHSCNDGRLAAEGVTTELERSPEDGRSKRSAWITFDGGEVLADIIVWDSGECEIGLRHARDPERNVEKHRDFATADDLHDALRFVLAHFR